MAQVQDRILFLERTDFQFVCKRRSQVIYLTLRRFIIGMEYGIILPSAWQYLKMMKAHTWFYGLVLSITPLCGIISNPIIGWTYDRTKKGKEVLYILNSLTLIGCLVYSLPFSPWFPFVGRLLLGFGVAEEPITQGEISWTRTKDKRFRIFAVVPFGFFMGLSCGPPINLAFEKVNFSLGAWRIDYRNFSGIFLAFLWVILILLNYFMYENLAKNYIDRLDNETVVGNETMMATNEKEAEYNTNLSSSEMLIQNENTCSESSNTRRQSMLAKLLREVLSPEILALMFCYFAIWLLIFEGESLISLMAQKDLGWNVSETSLIYLGSAIAIVFSYLFITLVSSKISDVTYILSALVIACLGPILLLTYSILRENRMAKELLASLAPICAGVTEPLSSTAIRSTISKVVPLAIQGSVIGVFTNTGKTAHIIGPLYGTLMYRYMLPCSVFNITMFVVGFIWIYVSIPKLNVRKIKYES